MITLQVKLPQMMHMLLEETLLVRLRRYKAKKSKIEEVASEESKIEAIEAKKTRLRRLRANKKSGLTINPSNRIAERFHLYGKRNMFISSEVEQAIGTLEKVILRVRQNRLNAEMQSSCFTNEHCHSNISSAGSNSLAKEVNHNKVVPTSPLCSSKDGASEIPVEDNIMHSTNQIIFKTSDTHESSSSTRRKSMRQRRRGFCCFSISPTQIDS
ncbi:hypothetical protein M0R45_030008 [Rubus argutus]|uniref:Uncharacterized protein n=1 Tax=Rubus argutus TaxID=59490 RepID=A0AAW1WBY7_RUBAR